MRLRTSQTGERLENLSKQQLIALLRSTYEYKDFAEYFGQHDLIFMDKIAVQSIKQKQAQEGSKEISDYLIVNQLQKINDQEGLNLHKYHQDLIFSKFKNYYSKYEEEKSSKIRRLYEQKIKKAENEAERSLPEELVNVCLQKQKELTKQVLRKKNKTLRM